MKEELSYVIITPYTVMKSRTGAIFSRLLTRLDLELVGVRIFAPDENLVKEYADSLLDLETTANSEIPARLISNYILENLMPVDGVSHRLMMLLFKGEDACLKIRSVCGSMFDERVSDQFISGETIRDTYGDLIWEDKEKGIAQYFEPAVLIPRTPEVAIKNLKMFYRFLDKAPNVVDNFKGKISENFERTLVIIKPDNWKHASARPGAIIDMFSRTGLRIVGCKLHRMSVAEGLEFYGPVENVLKDKLSPIFGNKAKEVLEKEFDTNLSEETLNSLVDGFGVEYARKQFYSIIEFMSGVDPEDCPEDELHNLGKAKCMVLIYEGQNAVEKIRKVLGPTDPTKAPEGTIRKEFGSNVMVNSAHASDSVENAKREMGIVKIEHNTLHHKIKEFYGL